MTVDRAELASRAFDDVGLDELLGSGGFDHLDRADIDTAVDEFARFAEEVIAPTDRAGDRIGCKFDPTTGDVTTPAGFVDAYRQYVDGGWGAASCDLEVGGGGLPRVVGVALEEIFGSANLGLSLCPALTHSAVGLVSSLGTDSQRERYLPYLLTGEWNGTMLITEPDAGSDVGAIRTNAEPMDDGRYALTGTKIFISWGEHDLTENVVHLVLARTPNSAPGTKGLSVFAVPKRLLDADGAPSETNRLHCAAIEHKMGLHASPTCVMELDGAIGELVGVEGDGMSAMFTMMNPARLSVGLQGLAVGEAAYAEAREFAADRLQGKRIDGDRKKEYPIECHPDVRRMLAQMRSLLDAMRLVIYSTALYTDLAAGGEASDRVHSQDMVDLLTPVAKGWVTDLGVEVASLGIQIHGGMGYIEDTAAPQHFRDSRIAPIYEGTNGIQAIDLVTRKITHHDGELIKGFLSEMGQDAKAVAALGTDGESVGAMLSDAISATRDASNWLIERQNTAPEDVLAGATAYMAMFGDLVGGWLLTRRALRRSGLNLRDGDEALAVARFYAIERLATVRGRLSAVTGGVDRLFI